MARSSKKAVSSAVATVEAVATEATATAVLEATETTTTEATATETPLAVERDAPEVRKAKVNAFLNGLLRARSGDVVGINDPQANTIRFSILGASTKLWFRMYKDSGNGYVTFYSTDGKTVLGNRPVYFGRDGSAASTFIGKAIKSGNIREFLAPKIRTEETETQLSLPVEQLVTDEEIDSLVASIGGLVSDESRTDRGNVSAS